MQGAWLESRSRYYVHSAFAAALAAANDFAHAGDANRLAWSDLLPSETRWLVRQTFFHLEVPHHEVERGDTNSRALFRKFDAVDELPQIFNVLHGEMSLVGPRPCTPNEFAHYEPWQRQRVNCLPGLTGYWQVNGKNKTTFREMIAMDLFYLKNMSIVLDLKIMLKTGTVMAGQLFESRQGPHRSRQEVGSRGSRTMILQIPAESAPEI